MNPPDPDSLSYRDAGVDIDRGNELVERIKPLAARTRRPGVLAGLGGFGALFEIPLDRYRRPVLVSGTDGVGTKLKLAIESGVHDTVGIDLVAMCVNDVLAQGAEPLFFLDYYATGRLDVDVAAAVVGGIARGCEQAGAALVGGETAEMPGMYADGDYDLAGFCVGIAEHDALLSPERVRPGDALVGLASSGPHSNGYSLIRRIVRHARADLGADFHGRSLGQTLLAPTRIYVKPVLALVADGLVHGVAHITGGGLTDNVPRMLPDRTVARIERGSWQMPAVFGWLQREGKVADTEMLRTFNCGVGMVLAVPGDRAREALERLAAAGEQAWLLGTVEAGQADEAHVLFA